MNGRLGLYSSIGVAATTAAFALGLLTGQNAVSYFVCLLLAWSYTLLACSFASEAAGERKALAYGGIAFACLYAVLIDVVYFAQLTTVASRTASPEALAVLSYESLGSLFFNLDLLGYGMLSISTLLVGATLEPRGKADGALKALLMAHGLFLVPCVALPMLNTFNAGQAESGAQIGVLVLLGWCAYFVPVGVLSTLHFVKGSEPQL